MLDKNVASDWGAAVARALRESIMTTAPIYSVSHESRLYFASPTLCWLFLGCQRVIMRVMAHQLSLYNIQPLPGGFDKDVDIIWLLQSCE